MYVCVCHAINSRDLDKAIKDGATSAADVHRYFGVDAKCGRCLHFIEDRIDCERCGNPSCAGANASSKAA